MRGNVIYTQLRKIAFMLDAERSHRLGMGVLSHLQSHPRLLDAAAKRTRVHDDRLRQTILGLTFENPVGLAAGFDKNAEVLHAWGGLGFGFVEVGTVTPKAQSGNPKPRLFRIPEEHALQNAMGFNNEGMDAMHERIGSACPLSFPLGINLGKNKDTPMEDALEDYFALIPVLDDVCDYFVLNLSSPNTPGLRDLENPDSIRTLFSRASTQTEKPVFLKVSPDSEPDYTVDLCATAVEAGAAGIIATNTSTDYSLTPRAKDLGGLSGAVIKEKSFAIFEAIARELFGKAVLISVGGIDSGKEAFRRIKAGASLIQIYTSLVYEGPYFVKRMNEELLECLSAAGLSQIGDAVGADRDSRKGEP